MDVNSIKKMLRRSNDWDNHVLSQRVCDKLVAFVVSQQEKIDMFEQSCRNCNDAETIHNLTGHIEHLEGKVTSLQNALDDTISTAKYHEQRAEKFQQFREFSFFLSRKLSTYKCPDKERLCAGYIDPNEITFEMCFACWESEFIRGRLCPSK